MTTELDDDTKSELIDLLMLARMLMAEQRIEESHIRVILTDRSEDADVGRATLMDLGVDTRDPGEISIQCDCGSAGMRGLLMTMAVSTLATSLLTDRVNEFIANVNDRIAGADDDTEEGE
ncbi:hypothetical protein [Bifidobacterium pseudolongum]|uniref:hypothetical protein n=1 Tax=Bifidobacterium pseudolongum TaxID=1694 RepID=UPI0010229121|nr:hypothetical protein [Bifidobacterium pseudolongum]RYQ42261.1 hypothetical protein PG1805B_1094 [Bifidobacterium pseudolongum subsp. globosum]